MDYTRQFEAKVRLTTFNKADITRLKRFHKKSVYDKIQFSCAIGQPVKSAI